MMAFAVSAADLAMINTTPCAVGKMINAKGHLFALTAQYGFGMSN